MKKNDAQNGLAAEMKKVMAKLQAGGDLGPLDHDGWNKLLASRPPEEHQLLEQLASFSDLWRYLQEHNQKLGPEIVDRLSGLNTLPVAERIVRLREINQNLMERVGDARAGAQLRH